MASITVISNYNKNEYSRQINVEKLLNSSPLFPPSLINKTTVDFTSTKLPPRILDYIFDMMDLNQSPNKITAYDYVYLLNAVETLKMDNLKTILTRSFEYNITNDLITSYTKHSFAEIIYRSIYDVYFQLNRNYLEKIGMYDPFKEKYIIESSKKAELKYDYFSTLDESRYSSLMPWHLPDVKRAFMIETKDIKDDIETIVDLTAHIGIDTVFLNIIFPTANSFSYEIDPKTFRVLRDNLLRYSILLGRTDPSTMMIANQNDSSKILTTELVKSAELVYFDPPWMNEAEGRGPDYIKQDNIRIYVGELNSADVVYKLFSNANPLTIFKRLVVLKAPKNINMKDFDNLPQISVNNKLHSIKYKKYDIHTKPIKKGGKISYILLFFRLQK